MRKASLVSSMDEFLASFKNSNQNLLLLVAEHCDFEHSRLCEINVNIRVSGAIFPQVIYKDINYDSYKFR